jgi:hypothetical protein
MRTGLPIAVVVILLASHAWASDEPDPRAGAWDSSVAQQLAGDLAGAEQTMIRGWGAQPDNYWVSLRLAYLALLQARPDEARTRYQALRERPEAAGDQDVPRGLASAIAAHGWALAKQAATTDARAGFRQALAIDPENPSAKLGLQTIPSLPIAVPELWLGLTGQSLGQNHYAGWASYAQLPVRLSDRLVLRVAGRYVPFWESSSLSPWALADRGQAAWTLNEQYLAVSYDSRLLGLEGVAARADTNISSAIMGGGARLRLGSSVGAFLETAVLHARRNPTNSQLRPMAFIWLGQHVGLQAGVRLTIDKRSTLVSANTGASFLFRPVTIHLQGHLGKERWAFGFAGPSVLSLTSAASYGGSVTLVRSLTKDLRLALQFEGESLGQGRATGAYWSISTGIQLGLGAR